MVSDNKIPTNHPIYSVQEDFVSCIFNLNDDTTSVLQVEKKQAEQSKIRDQDYMWQMYFDR